MCVHAGVVLLSLEFSCALIFCYYSWSSSYLVPPLCSIFLQMFEVPMSIASLSILFHQNHTNTMMLTLVLLFATDNIPKKNLMEIYSPRFSNYGHVSWKYQQKKNHKGVSYFLVRGQKNGKMRSVCFEVMSCGIRETTLYRKFFHLGIIHSYLLLRLRVSTFT